MIIGYPIFIIGSLTRKMVDSPKFEMNTVNAVVMTRHAETGIF